MKIGVLSLYKEREITGINKVTTGLMEELLKQDQENEYVFLGKNDWLDLDMDYMGSAGCGRFHTVKLCFDDTSTGHCPFSLPPF